MDGADTPRRPGGRPRSEQAHRSILDAAVELLAARGLDGVSVEDVARRAGVGKATIYRRWPNLDALALEALGDMVQPTGVATGDLRADLRRQVEDFLRLLAHPVARDVLLQFYRHGQGEAAIRLREGLSRRRRELFAQIVDEAVRAGGGPRYDAELLEEFLAGPVLYRTLSSRLPTDAAYLDRLVDAAIAVAAIPAVRSRDQ